MDISPIIAEKAPIILEEIKRANRILLHCHPSPDPDSVGSALAMKFVLEGMGKNVTVIKGDSEIPLAFKHFPGADSIVNKNFFEVDLNDFDLFISLDSASVEQISRFKPISLPIPIKTIIIDHHITNSGYGDINLIVNDYPATAQVLYELFIAMKVEISRGIAVNLFSGMYTDTGGFVYEPVNARTYHIAANLIDIAPDANKAILKMQYSNTPNYIYMQGMALNNIRTYFGDTVALSLVNDTDIKAKNIPMTDVRAGEISPILNTVANWQLVGVLFAIESNKIRVSFRTHDVERFDVSKLAASMGGGGHKAAAGAILNTSLEEAEKLVLSKIKELFNL